jgi:hypothetical protein
MKSLSVNFVSLCIQSKLLTASLNKPKTYINCKNYGHLFRRWHQMHGVLSTCSVPCSQQASVCGVNVNTWQQRILSDTTTAKAQVTAVSMLHAGLCIKAHVLILGGLKLRSRFSNSFVTEISPLRMGIFYLRHAHVRLISHPLCTILHPWKM